MQVICFEVEVGRWKKQVVIWTVDSVGMLVEVVGWKARCK